MNKKVIIPSVIAATFVIASLLSIKIIHAEDPAFYPPVVQKLAERFNLNEAEVQEVFDESWSEHQAERYAAWADRLDQAVEEGKLSQDQKEALIEKHDELHANMMLQRETRMQNMQQMHEEMEQWSEENGIELEDLNIMHGAGFRHGAGHGSGMGMRMGMH